MPSCMQYANMHAQYAIIHAQCIIVHTQHANMQYAVQPAVIQAQYACALQPPGTAHQRSKFMMSPQRDFPPHVLGRLKLLRSQAHSKTNIRDRWESHSQPVKGPGVRCIRYQGVWQFPRAADMTDNWEKLCLLLCYLLKFSWSHCIYSCINGFATSRDHCTCSYSSI